MKKGMPATSPRGASNNYLLLTKNVKYLDRLGYIRFPFLTMYRQNIRRTPAGAASILPRDTAQLTTEAQSDIAVAGG